MQSADMGATKLQLVGLATAARRQGKRPSPGSVQSSTAAISQQVAAVCYRLRNARIQFLLVQTRKRRWIFPKGCIEPGLTYAQSAALEAFEEAGVHGRLEENSFARYTLRKRGKLKQHDASEILIHCHLCEVLRLERPQEANRNPTWFFPEKAKSYLKAERKPDNGAELVRIIDRAVNRVGRLQQAIALNGDGLKRVEFEASQIKMRRLMAGAVLSGFVRGSKRDLEQSATLRVAVNADRRKLLRLGPAPPPANTNQRS